MLQAILVAMWSRALVCGGLNAETTGSNPTEDVGIHLLCLNCVVKVMAWPLRQADHSFRSLNVYVCVCVCVCVSHSVSSRNFQNEAA